MNRKNLGFSIVLEKLTLLDEKYSQGFCLKKFQNI